MTSLDQLVRRVQVPLVQFLTYRTRCRADAEDLAQETWVRAYRALPRYEPRYRFRTWLLTIAHRLSLNHRRREGREESLARPDEIARPATEPVDSLIAEERRRSIWSVASKVLDCDQVTVLWLHYVEELSTADVANLTGRSRGAVKTMLFRARQELLPHLCELAESSRHGPRAVGRSG